MNPRMNQRRTTPSPNVGNRRRHNPQKARQIHGDNEAQLEVDDGTNEYTETSGNEYSKSTRIVLDSAAHPTHHPYPVAPTRRVRTPAHTQTAKTQHAPITHSGMTRITTPTQQMLTTTATSPTIPDTRLCVRSIVTPNRWLIFKPHYAYALHPKQIKAVIHHERRLATCSNDVYIFNGTVHMEDTYRTAAR